MKKNLAILLLALLCGAFNPVSAQDPAADSVDVLHYNLTIDLGATVSKQLRGVADITFVLTKPCTSVTFDLICDSLRPVSLDGTVTRGFSYDSMDRLLRVSLSGARPGDTHTISVPYVSNGYVEHYGWGGLHMNNNLYYNLGVAFQEYPHVFGRAWFPCRDNMYDKATYTLTVSSQPGWRAICSGLRQNETTSPDGILTSTWSIAQPTPTYLVSISSAPWHIIERQYQGLYGTYPALIGYLNHDSTRVQQAFDILDDVLPAYERTFGPYRWDRIGYISTPMGSMEHVSNIGLVSECAASTESPCQMTMCHELGHAWFGNLVTCTTPGDMWINEGGASFCEEVAAEAAYGKPWAIGRYQDNLARVVLNAHLQDGAYRALSGMPELYTYGTTTYDKGALVWHSLRGLMGDSLFAQCMNRLFTSAAFGNIDAAALRDSLSLYSGLDLAPFFDFHVFNPGFVDYSVDLFGINGFQHHIAIHQRLRGTDRYANACPVPVTFFSPNRSQSLKLWFTPTRPSDTFSITLPFEAAFAIVDFDRQISDACTDDGVTLTRKGTTTLSHTYAKLYLSDDLEQPSWVHVSHHFANPGGDTIEGIIRLADRYWQVTGTNLSSVECRFLYNLGSNGSSGASNLDRGFFDRAATLDSLCLLYRPANGSPWQVISHRRTRSSSISTGHFVASLLAGQYTLGVCDTNLLRLNPAPTGPAFTVSPNPSTSSLTLHLGGYDKKFDAFIFDILGKKVLEMHNLSDGSTIPHHLPAGTYIVLIKNNFLSLQSQIIVQ